MSRSYKYPIFKDKPDKYFKKLSNKRNRQWLKSLNKGFKSTHLFKILVDRWDICDWKFIPDTNQINKARRK